MRKADVNQKIEQMKKAFNAIHQGINQQPKPQQPIDNQNQVDLLSYTMKQGPQPTFYKPVQPRKSTQKYEIKLPVIGEETQINLSKVQKKKLNSQYQIGQFSKFAVERQKKAIFVEKYINNVIRQGVISHLKRLQRVMAIDTQLQIKSIDYQNRIKRYLKYERKQQLKRILETPIQYFIETHETELSGSQFVRQFIRMIFSLSNYTIVQGKIIEKTNLLLNQYHKIGQHYLLPVKTNKQLYVKLNQEGKHSFLYKFDNQFFNRQQLKNLNSQQKTRIISEVKAFLENKGILLTQQRIQNRISQIMADVQSN